MCVFYFVLCGCGQFIIASLYILVQTEWVGLLVLCIIMLTVHKHRHTLRYTIGSWVKQIWILPQTIEIFWCWHAIVMDCCFDVALCTHVVICIVRKITKMMKIRPSFLFRIQLILSNLFLHFYLKCQKVLLGLCMTLFTLVVNNLFSLQNSRRSYFKHFI